MGVMGVMGVMGCEPHGRYKGVSCMGGCGGQLWGAVVGGCKNIKFDNVLIISYF